MGEPTQDVMTVNQARIYQTLSAVARDAPTVVDATTSAVLLLGYHEIAQLAHDGE